MKRSMQVLLVILLVVGGAVRGICQQKDDKFGFDVTETPAQKTARMKWFNEARFGMFIHWGLYSAFAGDWEKESGHGEWIFLMANIPCSDS